MKFLGNEAQ